MEALPFVVPLFGCAILPVCVLACVMCRQNGRISHLESEVAGLVARGRATSPPPGFIGGVSFGGYAPPPSAPPMVVYTSTPPPTYQPRQWAPPPGQDPTRL
jgi:hypothetical protein